MRTGQRRFLATALVGVLAFVGAACGDDDDDDGATDTSSGGATEFEEGDYVFGVNAELSGPIPGKPLEDGIRMYANQVNAAGGINGHRVEVVSLDTAADASRAAANSTQLVTANKVTAIFGHLLSANCTAATPAVERAETPMACLSVAEQNEWVFNLGADNSRAAHAFTAAGQEVAGKKDARIAFAYITTLTNTALSEAMPDAVEEAGATLSASEGLALTAADFSGPAASLVASNPDVILVTTANPSGVLKAVRDAGFDGPVVALDGSGGLGLFNDADPDMHVLSVYKYPDPASSDPATKRFVEAVETVRPNASASFKELVKDNFIPAYLTASAFGEALKECGYPCPGPELKDELEKTSMELGEMLPSFEYKPGDHYPYGNLYLYKLKPGGADFEAELPLEEE